MSIIEWEKDGTVAVIKLNSGENRHNLEFAQTFNRVLDEVIEDKDVTAAIVTSTDQKCWSLGIDVESNSFVKLSGSKLHLGCLSLNWT